MQTEDFNELFTDDVLRKLFPDDRADLFFEALLGEAEEGAYDIELKFSGFDRVGKTLNFALHLKERPHKCLACNLTRGLPEVFARHPIINIKGLVREIEQILIDRARCSAWSLGHTVKAARDLHAIPLTITLDFPAT